MMLTPLTMVQERILVAIVNEVGTVFDTSDANVRAIGSALGHVTMCGTRCSIKSLTKAGLLQKVHDQGGRNYPARYRIAKHVAAEIIELAELVEAGA